MQHFGSKRKYLEYELQINVTISVILIKIHQLDCIAVAIMLSLLLDIINLLDLLTFN